MQVKPEDIASHLKLDLKPVYLVSGDETLLVEEVCDQVVQAAHERGYTERSVHHVEGGFHWHDLHHDAASLSLFAQRKLLDVRVPVKKFDREASDELRDWITQQPTDGEPDTVMLIRSSRLEPRQRSSAWFKAIEKAGVVSLIWPMSPQQLPRWLSDRLRRVDLQVAREALAYLSDRVEGNLLAAAQEVEKLALLDLPQPVSLESMVASLEDAARFNSFDLLDAVMAGDAARTTRILHALREEGVALFAILGALTSQLRRFGNTRGLPPARQRLMSQFQKRIKDPAVVLAECAIIDQQGKGQRPGEAWISLENLLLRLSGVRAVPLPSEDMQLLA